MTLRRLRQIQRVNRPRPGHDDEEARRQVVDVQVLELVTGEGDLDPGDGVVAQVVRHQDPVLVLQVADLKGVIQDRVPLRRVVSNHRLLE